MSVAAKVSPPLADALDRSPPGLDIFDRLILKTDGTVTALLETCTAEPIATSAVRESGPAGIDALLEEVGRWWTPDERLAGLRPDERVIARRAILRGARTSMPYVVAESLLLVDRLPAAVIERLHAPGGSLGRVLVDLAIESRRAILSVMLGQAGGDAEALATTPDALVGRRAYAIIISGQIATLVTETLPAGRLGASRR